MTEWKRFRRRPRIDLDDQLSAEIERTGINVDIWYSDWSLEWFAIFTSASFEYRSDKRAIVVRAAIQRLAEAPDKDQPDYD